MMTRAWLRFAWMLPLPFAALIGLAMGLGTLRPIPPALMGFIEGCEDIPQPCWYGIVPGVTSLDEARMLLFAYGEYPTSQDFYPLIPNTYTFASSTACSVTFATDRLNHRVGDLMLSNCQNVLLGDVTAVLGNPEGLGLDPYIGINYGPLFANQKIFVVGDGLWLEERVGAISLSPTSMPTFDPWRGFISIRRYCVFEPHARACTVGN